MHELTAHKARPVRFRAWLWDGTEYRFQFQSFQVESKRTSYTLRLADYNKSASSSASAQCEGPILSNSGQKFSTIDRNNNNHGRHCAQEFGGAGWWYEKCTNVSPNVEYCPSESCGSNFKNIKVHCLKTAAYSMKRFQIDLFIE